MGISIHGAEAADQLLRDMAHRAHDLTPVWPAVGDMLALAEREQYASEGTYLTGKAWAPLSPRYLAWKTGHGYPAHIEILTGSTLSKLTSRPMDVETYTRTSAEFGVKGKIAFWQQYGTRKMPARPLIRLTETTSNKANSLIARWVVKGRVGL